MIFRKTAISGLFEVVLQRHEDDRGAFARTFCQAEFAAHGLLGEFVQASTSWNLRAGTLRGMHFQRAPHAEGKLVRCVRGAIHDVVADLRRGSPTFMRWQAFTLREDGDTQLYIPPGCAHGFLTLRDRTEVLYQMTLAFVAEAGSGFRFDDAAFGIVWPAPAAIVSDKDLAWPSLSETALA